MNEGSKVSIRSAVPIRLDNGVVSHFITFHGLADGKEHLAVVFQGKKTAEAPLVRVHSECLTGDVFKSQRCDCGHQLSEAMNTFSETGGVLLYLRQEGRGIGLYNKLDAYRLQTEDGLNTYDANRKLHLPDDARDYAVAAQMLMALGMTEIKLLTNNPDKVSGLQNHGIAVVEVIPTGTYKTPDNESYLRAKKVQTGHTLKIG